MAACRHFYFGWQPPLAGCPASQPKYPSIATLDHSRFVSLMDPNLLNKGETNLYAYFKKVLRLESLRKGLCLMSRIAMFDLIKDALTISCKYIYSKCIKKRCLLWRYLDDFLVPADGCFGGLSVDHLALNTMTL